MGKYRQQLINSIVEKRREDYSIVQIASETFRFQPKMGNLSELFDKRENKNESWRQLVRFIFFEKNEKRYLSERIMRLLFNYHGTYKKHFFIEDEFGKQALPDRLSDYLRLMILSKEYYEIYQKIMRRINFDYPQKKFSGTRIRGKIHWGDTLRNSTSPFPLKFESRSWVREFETPENILLVLCSFWLKNDVLKILNSSLAEPLQTDEKEILVKILDTVNKILTSFQFQDIVRKAKSYFYHERDSKKISDLIQSVQERSNTGKIRNKQYRNLLSWIKKYGEIDLHGSAQNNKFVIESTTSIDTLYEVLIFLEFLDYLKREEKLNPVLEKYDSKYRILYSVNGKDIEFYHGKYFSKEKTNAWAVDSEPDFCAISNGQLVAVFDAKNYRGIDKSIDENTTCERRFLESLSRFSKIKPEKIDEFCVKWPEMDKTIVEKYLKLKEKNMEDADEFTQKLESEHKAIFKELKKQRDDDKTSHSNRVNDAKRIMLAYLANLDVHYGGLIFPKTEPNSFQNFESTPPKSRCRKDMTLAHYRLDYNNSEESKKNREFTMKSMFQSIAINAKKVKKHK